jgi:Outer membrane protein beta-barrel domain
MKKITAIIGFVLLALAVNAQAPKTVSLNVYGGYTFTDRVRFDAAYADVMGAFQWGGGLEYFPTRDNSVELKYQRMATDFPLYIYNGSQINKGNESGAVSFITIGGNHYFSGAVNDAKVIPFIGGSLGVGILDGPENSETKFGWDAQVGLKIPTKSVASFKLRAYIQSITSTFGTDFWYYPGWGTVAVPDYVTMFQFGLGGVVTFDFNKNK